MLWLFSVRNQLLIALAICLFGTASAWWAFTAHQHSWQHWLACWLAVVNVVTFAYFGLDKWLASRVMILRIPEAVLHTLSGIGGSPGALFAMTVFRHKTIKQSFRIVFWCLVVLQLAVAIYIVKLLWWT